MIVDSLDGLMEDQKIPENIIQMDFHGPCPFVAFLTMSDEPSLPLQAILNQV